MTPERTLRAEEIRRRAMTLEAARRSAFIAEACGPDAELLREVEAPGSNAAQPVVTGTAGAGMQFGPYLIESEIGKGGMGEVFRALDTRLGRTVAIKFLLPERVADAGHKRRFIQEARAASALSHPNIVALYDISSHEGRDFLVMEYVPGQTLNKLLVDGSLPVDSVIRVGEQIASALAAAHGAGILHRDIKPANIMVTPARRIKVLDFGIASMSSGPGVDSDVESPTVTQLTTPGMVVGTYCYMSPEQAQGKTADGRSDIFSLGCVLYEAITGRLPFHGSSALAVMHEVLTADPPSARSLRPDLPYALDQLIASCLQKDPARRPASAAEVERQLQSLAATADPVVPVSRSGRRSVAVMPFRFRTAQPEDQFLSLALTEAVVNRLASLSEMVVRPVASVLRYSGNDVEWTQVARELNVDFVVEGSIQKAGPRVRVLLQVMQANGSVPVHSARHDGDMCDLFGLQDRIADSVSDVFVPRKTVSAEPSAPPTQNPAAYELYMRAADRLAHWNKFDITAAIGMLSRVVELDADFADAWGQLAYACSQMGMHLDPDPQWFERAEQAISRTLELDPLQCDALCARAQIAWSPSRGFQNLPALRAMNAALKIHPGRYYFRHFRGAILFHLGFFEHAEHDMEEALIANPGYALSVTSLGMIAEYRGDYAVSDEMYIRSMKMDPTLMHTNIFSPRLPLLMGRLEEARARIRRARQIVPEESKLTSMEGLLAAQEGDWKRAEQLADDACSENRKSMTHTHHTWHCAAGVYAICGKPEKAIVQLQRCADLGLPNYRLFTTDPHLAALRTDPAFMALMSDLRRKHDQYASAVEPIPGVN